MDKNLDIFSMDINTLKGVGPARKKLLARLGISNIFSLLYYLPRSYLDRSKITPIAEVKDTEEEITVIGKIQASQKIRTRYGKNIAKVALADDSGQAYGVWFHYPNVIDNFKKGDQVLFSGKLNSKSFQQWGRVEFNHPTFEIIGESNLINSGRIVPVYGLTEGLSQKFLRELLFNALEKYSSEIKEILPPEIIKNFKLENLQAALLNIHFPSSIDNRNKAYRRLAFEELFLFHFKLARRQLLTKGNKGFKLKASGDLLKKFIKDLPFKLTDSQKKVWRELEADMERETPMNRLLQGDVGSGKTIIALLTLLKGLENNLQGAFMAPTEILAEQHYFNMKKILPPLGIEPRLYTGSLSKKEKEDVLNSLENGELALVVGTHALIQKNVKFKNLGAVVIDEQHRFGVEQRKLLEEKGRHPHLLVMTATPIPRSLAFTMYGDLDYSAITQLPPGRKKIVTRWRTDDSRQKIYDFIETEIKAGRQTYVVCPLVSESEKLQVEAAEIMYEKLKKHYSKYSLGLIHGQMPVQERDQIMEDFRKNKINLLVATTVIEVGVDIPNATVMLIEDAQRFGLAQLHQLRGRVGRSNAQSYCILLSNAQDELAQKRMTIMEKTNDGFLLAEEDLKIRGAGEFFGTQQHGYSSFKVADLTRDIKIILGARNAARNFLMSNPNAEHVFLPLEEEAERRFPGDVII